MAASKPFGVPQVALLALVTIMATYAQAEQADLDVFTDHGDVGQVALPGDAKWDAASQTFTIDGAGVNMWNDQDECHFVWKKMKGDFQVTAEVALAPAKENSIAHRKLGVMIRSSLDGDATYADVAVHGDGLTSLQFRKKKGDVTEQIPAVIVGANVVQLARKGNKIVQHVAFAGSPFVEPESVELDLGDEVFVGLYVCSHDANIMETGTFKNVRITVPAPDDFVPYRDYIGSDLEILDIDSGRREIIFHAPDSIQAPNWTPDGKALIYNSNGKLYRFDLETCKPTVIDSGFATANNNDHVISFDGKQLGISHHATDDQGRSNIYVMPIEGGEPRRVTKRGPSYFHGWSPDDKTLVYTAERGDSNYDIWAIPSAGGEEKRLTETDSLDDGPEYAPDGSRIYFNSTRTGNMQIWRMYPSGGDPEQVTFDQYNNWFPHISPDSKHIVYLSYLPDVEPADHPFYKQVYLQLMPYPGGPSKVIAYVYGGQGTINVPSWSPDSKRMAFVSNSQ